jgi:hypothetical protein
VPLRDTAAADRRDTGQRAATVRLEAGPDSAGVLSLTYIWLGTARTVPVGDQRRPLALATDVLAHLREACAPTAPRPSSAWSAAWAAHPRVDPPPNEALPPTGRLR